MKTEPNDDAFAAISADGQEGSKGLTKREYFAAMAMQGIIIRGCKPEEIPKMGEAATLLAKNLIEALNKETNEEEAN